MAIYSGSGNAQPSTNDCGDALELEQSFSSGASWSLCVNVDKKHALEVNAVRYRAPGDTLRSVMNNMHVAQILMHFHNETNPRPQIGSSEQSRQLIMSALNCDGTLLFDDGRGPLLCSQIKDNRTLAKYAQRPSIQSQRWEISAAFQIQGLVWTTSINFEEDGRITPGVTLSGQARTNTANDAFSTTLPISGAQLPRATILSSWRLVFNLDEGDFDSVQQFDFPLNASDGNRRAMQVSELTKETLINVDRENFRAWRIKDAKGPGYYLDPSNSGYNFTGGEYEWAKHDLVLTRFKACERYALNNARNPAAIAACDESLDAFVNAESLQDAHPVLWFNQSRTFNPGNEDWPVISNFHQSFTLLPFDWTPASPFEVSE